MFDKLMSLLLDKVMCLLLDKLVSLLLDKVHLLADQLDLFVFLLVVFELLFFEIVTACGVDRDDERAEFFYAAFPDCFRGAEIEPVYTGYLFNT